MTALVSVTMLRITQCSDAMRWYAPYVGQLVPYEGQDLSDGWASCEPAGHRNYVLRQDARRVRVQVPEDWADAWPYQHALEFEQFKHATMMTCGAIAAAKQRADAQAAAPDAAAQAPADQFAGAGKVIATPGQTGQSRRHSAVEACVNIAVGLFVSFGLTATVMPAFGYHVTADHNVAITLIFTAASLVRSYSLRRLFNAWQVPRA